MEQIMHVAFGIVLLLCAADGLSHLPSTVVYPLAIAFGALFVVVGVGHMDVAWSGQFIAITGVVVSIAAMWLCFLLSILRAFFLNVPNRRHPLWVTAVLAIWPLYEFFFHGMMPMIIARGQ